MGSTVSPRKDQPAPNPIWCSHLNRSNVQSISLDTPMVATDPLPPSFSGALLQKQLSPIVFRESCHGCRDIIPRLAMLDATSYCCLLTSLHCNPFGFVQLWQWLFEWHPGGHLLFLRHGRCSSAVDLVTATAIQDLLISVQVKMSVATT